MNTDNHQTNFSRYWEDPIFNQYSILMINESEDIKSELQPSIKRKKPNPSFDEIDGNFEEEDYGNNIAYSSNAFPDERLLVNPILLSESSLFFEKLFSNGMKETGEKEVEIIQRNTLIIKIKMTISKDDRSFFRDLIRFVYTRNFNTTGINLLRVIFLADKYEMISAGQMASASLANTLTTDDVCAILDFLVTLPSVTCFTDIINNCRKFMYRKFEDLDKEDTQRIYVEDLWSYRAANLVLTNSYMKVDSENTVFQIVKRWLKHSPERMIHAPRMVALLRFYTMSPDFLRYVVLPSDILFSFCSTDVVKFKDLIAQAIHYSMSNPDQKKVLYSIQDGIKKKLMVPRVNTPDKPFIYTTNVNVDATEPVMSSGLFFHGYYMNVQYKKITDNNVAKLSIQLILNHQKTGANTFHNATSINVEIFLKSPTDESWRLSCSVKKMWLKENQTNGTSSSPDIIRMWM